VADSDIEAAIVKAMLEGRGQVAETLTRALRERREAAAGNVVSLDQRARARS